MSHTALPPESRPEPTGLGSQEPAPSMADRATEAIRNSIIYEGMVPGSFLSQRELALKLQMSQTPVREAFIRLEREGLLRIVPKRGAVVADLSIHDLNDICAIRGALEGTAAQAVAGNIPLEFLTGLRNQIVAAEDAGDHQALYRLGESLHVAIMDYCPYPRLATLAATMRQHIVRYSILASQMEGQSELSTHDHKLIIDCLLNADGDASRAAVETHVEQLRSRIVETFVSRPGAGVMRA